MATLTFSLSLKPTEHVFTPGPLHQLFSLPQTLHPRYLHLLFLQVFAQVLPSQWRLPWPLCLNLPCSQILPVSLTLLHLFSSSHLTPPKKLGKLFPYYVHFLSQQEQGFFFLSFKSDSLGTRIMPGTVQAPRKCASSLSWSSSLFFVTVKGQEIWDL